MDVVKVTPSAYRQFADRHRHFYLVTDAHLHDALHTFEDGPYSSTERIAAPAGTTLGDLLRERIPEDADVLVVASRPELGVAADEAIGPHRTVVAVPVADGDTHTKLADAAELLRSLQDTDPAHDEQTRLRSLLTAGGGLIFSDELTGASATLGDSTGVVVRGSFGSFRPGTLHTAPNGWLSADNAAGGPLPLSGELAAKGWPAVYAGTGSGQERRPLYEGLLPLSRYPVVLTVDQGIVTDVKGVESGSDGAAETLLRLFEADDRYRQIRTVGFGTNPAVPALRSNSEIHRVQAGRRGPSPYVLLGAPGAGTLEVLLHLESSEVSTATGEILAPGAAVVAEVCEIPPAGTAGRTRGKMNRVRSASCGCH